MIVHPKGQVLTFEMAVGLQGHRTASRWGAATNAGSRPGWRRRAGWLPATAGGSKSVATDKSSGVSTQVRGGGALDNSLNFWGGSKEPLLSGFALRSFGSIFPLHLPCLRILCFL